MTEHRPGRAAEQWLTAGLFFAFVLGGAGYIVLAKLSGLPAVMVTFVPVGVMVVYLGVVTMVRGTRLRDDQTGDNIYYMGFLFTLTSLGVSLFQFDAEAGASEIVRNFGIAIGSTITGVALRVMFNQMRRDPVEVERVARLDLAEAARRVKQELDNTVIEFGHFRRAAQQSIAEGFDEMRQRVEEHSGRVLASLDQVSTNAAPLVAAGQALLGSVKDVGQAAGALGSIVNAVVAESGSVATALQKLGGAIAETDERLRKLGEPGSLIKVELQPLSDQFNATVAELRRAIVAHADEMERISRGLGLAPVARTRWRWWPIPHRVRLDRPPREAV